MNVENHHQDHQGILKKEEMIMIIIKVHEVMKEEKEIMMIEEIEIIDIIEMITIWKEEKDIKKIEIDNIPDQLIEIDLIEKDIRNDQKEKIQIMMQLVMINNLKKHILNNKLTIKEIKIILNKENIHSNNNHQRKNLVQVKALQNSVQIQKINKLSIYNHF